MKFRVNKKKKTVKFSMTPAEFLGMIHAALLLKGEDRRARTLFTTNAPYIEKIEINLTDTDLSLLTKAAEKNVKEMQ